MRRSRQYRRLVFGYQVANGMSLPNLGEKRVAVITEEGSIQSLTCQLADVSSRLMSVRAMCKSNHMIVFDEEASYAINKQTGERNWIHDDGTNYTMKHWIILPEKIGEMMEASGFPRQV